MKWFLTSFKIAQIDIKNFPDDGLPDCLFQKRKNDVGENGASKTIKNNSYGEMLIVKSNELQRTVEFSRWKLNTFVFV